MWVEFVKMMIEFSRLLVVVVVVDALETHTHTVELVRSSGQHAH